MALIVDAGALYAQADADEPRHAAVARLLREERGQPVTSELAVAEADYLILDRLGIEVELAFLDDLASAPSRSSVSRARNWNRRGPSSISTATSNWA